MKRDINKELETQLNKKYEGKLPKDVKIKLNPDEDGSIMAQLVREAGIK